MAVGGVGNAEVERLVVRVMGDTAHAQRELALIQAKVKDLANLPGPFALKGKRGSRAAFNIVTREIDQSRKIADKASREQAATAKKLSDYQDTLKINSTKLAGRQAEQNQRKIDAYRLASHRKTEQLIADATKHTEQQREKAVRIKAAAAKAVATEGGRAQKLLNQHLERQAKLDQVLHNQATSRRAASVKRQELLDQTLHNRTTTRVAAAAKRQELLDQALHNRGLQRQKQTFKEQFHGAQRVEAIRRQQATRNRAQAGFIGGGLGGVISGRAGGFAGAAIGGTVGGGVIGGTLSGVLGGAIGLVTNLTGSILRLGASLVTNVIGLGVRAFETMGDFIVSTTVQSVKAYAALEQLRVTFDTMTGSTEKGGALVKQLQQMGAVLPVSAEALQGSATLLLQYGVEAENVAPILKMIGDISGGSAEKMGRISLAFGQVVSAGRLLGTEVRQLAEAGWNPLENIAAATGKTVAQLRDEMAQGMNPTVGQVTRSMIAATSAGGRFHGLMEKMSTTLAGSWRMAGSQILLVMQQIGEGVAKGGNLQGLVTVVGEGMRDIGIPAAQQLKRTLMAFSPMWNQLRDAAVDAWRWTAPVRQSVTDLFVAIEKNAFILWNALWKGAGSAWEMIGRTAGISWDGIRKSITDAIDTATFTIENFEKHSETMFNEIGYQIQKVWEVDFPKYVAKGIEEVGKILLKFGTLLGPIASMFAKETPEEKAAKDEAARRAKEHMDKMKKLREDFETWQFNRDLERLGIAGGIYEEEEKKARNALDIPPVKFQKGWENAADKVKEKLQQTFNAARFASAEALTRVSEYVDRLTLGVKAQTPGRNPMVPTPAASESSTRDTVNPIVDEIKKTNSHLRDIKNKPTIPVEDADL